jgi:hypothetical protein
VYSRCRSVLSFYAALLFASLLAATGAQATDFVVTNTNSSGPGSLAFVVAQANGTPGPHNIAIQVTGNIVLTNPLALSRAMTISGPAGHPGSVTLSGQGTHRIFVINAGAGNPVTLRYLTLADGNAGDDGGGAIIVNFPSTLTLAHCTLSGNVAHFGGALFNDGTLHVDDCFVVGNSTNASAGGAIYNTFALTVERSTFVNNISKFDGGAIENVTGATLTVTDTEFRGNKATAGGGGGGGIANYGIAKVIRSTFSGNSGVGYGGAIRADASGTPHTGSLTIVNSTFSNNTGGGPTGAGGGAIASVNQGTVRIFNSTVAFNHAGSAASGGGLYAGGGTTMTIANSIVAYNDVPEGRSGPDCVGQLTSEGYNILHDNKDCTIVGTADGNQIGVEVGLLNLAGAGGLTPVHAFVEPFAGVDAGNPNGCVDENGAPLATDQRGIARPLGDACDIGAYERTPFIPSGRFQGLFWRFPAGSEAGWGINFAHQGNTLFATWFTYGSDGKPLWLAAVLQFVGPGIYAGNVFTVTGPSFDAVPWDPALVVETTVGNAIVAFGDPDNGVFTYTINGIVTQAKPITRQLFAAPVPVCTWDSLADLSLATNFQDLWWASPPGSQSGWGTNFTHQGDVIFLTWFTYDAAGKPLWFIAVADKQSAGVYSGPISTVTGPPYWADPFDPANVVETVVGTITITFADGNHATYDYTINGVHQVKTITRQVFTEPGTVCQ